VLDAGVVAHLAVIDGGQPFVVPTAYARVGDAVLCHGSTASRLMRSLAAGSPTCLTVTLYDGLVLARSAFEHSMHYRSAMVLGSCSVVPDSDKAAALEAMSERWLPGRWADARPPSGKELAATLVLSLPLTGEWSVKVSDAPPEDDESDMDRRVWAGVLPVRQAPGTPIAAPDLRHPVPVPPYVAWWTG
jgi:hypothetical protein